MKTTVSNAAAQDSHRHATEIDLLENPLDFLTEDHMRTRTVCATFDRLSQADHPERADLFEAASFLENELPMLLLDEDADLDRMLRKHLDAAPELATLLDRVSRLHREIANLAAPILSLMTDLRANPRALTDAEKTQIAQLAKTLREDMAIENAKLLPLARKLLSDDDLADLRSAMFQRRLSDFRDHRA